MKQKMLFKSTRLKETWAPLVMALFLPVSGFAVMPPIKKIQNNSIVSPLVNITGTIKDSNGQPLPGASVKIKGTNTGTSTDGNGAFKLNLPTGNETIVITMMGYKTQEIAMAGKTTISVTLTDEASDLDEVVVVGYGTVKKRDLTGSVASVKAEDIVLSPVSHPMEALQGRVAGLDIQRSSGKSGSSPGVLLRGNRSLLADQSPLYIIDGIQGSIDDVNPNDIESIDILKDASSTAIYGSAGGNGVIMVTTKKGAAGQVKVDLNSYYGINGFATYPKPLMGQEWIKYLNDRYFAANGHLPNDLSALQISDYEINAIEAGQWVDWVDETLKTGVQQNHHVSLRGGSEKVQAFLSFGYIGEKGIYKFDKNEAFNGRTGADVKFNNILKAGVQGTFNWGVNDGVNSRVNQAYGISPLGLPYLPNGDINLYPLGKDAGFVSPIANYAPGVFANNEKRFNLAINPYLEITPMKNLTIRSNLGVSLSNSRTGTFQNENSFNLASENRITKEATYSTALSNRIIWENIVNYNFTLKENHNFTVTGITSMSKSKNEASFMGGSDMDYDEFLFYNLGAIRNLTSYGSSYEGKQQLSFAGRVNYNYKSKYLFTGSIRWDGVSQLVKRWSAFPSFSGAWVISQEDFMGDTKSWLSNLKLRAGYGVAGTSNIPGNARTTEVVSRPGTNLPLGGSALLPVYVLKKTLANPNLTWEKAHTTNIGLDASFLNNRIDLNVDWYHTRTNGVLYARKLPFTSGGFDAKNPYEIYSNIATTENKGIELAISSKNIVNDNFKWNSAFTFTKYKEKLVNIDLGNSVTPDELISEGLFIGQPLHNIYGYKKIGVWQLGEEEEALKYGSKPGDIKLATVPKTDVNGVSDNGVHKYSKDDRMLIGQKSPKWTMGLQNTFTYKNLDLTVYAVMRYGQFIDAPILGYYNKLAQPASYDYWTPSNPTNDFPQPNLMDNGNNKEYRAALSYVDGSYMKIKNVTLGYTIPNDFGKKIGLSRLRIYGTVYNPFIFAKSDLLKDVDPEGGGSDSFPLYKQVVFGLNASF